MKNNGKRILCAALAAALAMPLAACSTEQPESGFDEKLPWHAVAVSYEKLDYKVAVYNTEKSESESEREKIADGTLTFTLDEGAEPGYTTLDMSFSVKYIDNTEKAGVDAGLTDAITSHVVFEANSLAAKSMEKTVTLADRKDKTNLSYKVTADYFETHKATMLYTKQDGAKEQTMDLPRNAARDNEMMFFVARAQGLSASSSTNFKMINVFDSFISGEVAEYRIAVAGGSERAVDLGEWVKDFGIKAAEGENVAIPYPVNCTPTTLTINADKHGPSYTVLYAKDSFLQGEAEHKKLPVKIDYSSYQNAKPYRHTEYVLAGCSFTK
ncbi:MAG: hypothetical protein K2O04_04605 [Clostridiales bacterium]|nr:hypothetical protein [Clostridiales bacterium]